ncbi:MAG: hypothetical protein NVSMB25_26090 [Thermoleophilaceae bacterium]
MGTEPEDSLDRYHDRARRRGVNPYVYWPARAIIQPFLLVYLRLRRVGREHIPSHGGVLLASNHRSFLDPFLIGCCIRRPIYFVAKRELFANRLQGWFLNSLGAFPIRRGESDEHAIETAKEILARGDAVVIFPEGTRVRSGSLGRPRRGVGRLALESGAPVVPIAVTGSERARRGLVVRPVKVAVRCGRPLTFPRVEGASSKLAAEVTARIWPCVELQWEWLGGLPPLRKAAVVGAGEAGTAIAGLLARAGLEVAIAARPEDRGSRRQSLPEGVSLWSLAEVEFAGVDLVVLAISASELPAAVARLGDRVGSRSAVLVVSKGVVAPLALLPSQYVEERVPARAIAALGGPRIPAGAAERGASVVLASEQEDFLRQMSEVLERAGLRVERSNDVVGVELAGAAKNVATLAAWAAAPDGTGAAGVAASSVFSEIAQLAWRAGAQPETVHGLAGTGDLIATVLAPQSSNRRAGELLAAGVAAGDIGTIIGGPAEALHSVALLVKLGEERRIDMPATSTLCALVEGRIDASGWAAAVRDRGNGSPERSAA